MKKNILHSIILELLNGNSSAKFFLEVISLVLQTKLNCHLGTQIETRLIIMFPKSYTALLVKTATFGMYYSLLYQDILEYKPMIPDLATCGFSSWNK